ncbi:uncharacterized protein LOC134253634 [Saccostrea cucullata]|uniref:uncharacterized protein LOC134253634 n=1 Tax=Saccostrea cuccullata TaxID=36930 RepID=UPI002ED39204
MITNLVLITSSLLYSSSSLKTTIASQKDNKCLQSDGTRQCCSSFYEEDDTCHECIGSYGVNCSHPCKPGFFGPKCAFKCKCLNNTCDRIHGCFEDVTEGPVKDLDFFGHLKFHWMVFLVIFIFTFILLVCGIVTLKGRSIKRRQKRQLTQSNNYTMTIFRDQASGYSEMEVTPHASTEYLNASFQKQPIDDITSYFSTAEYLRMDVTPHASTEYLNASFQTQPIDNVSGYVSTGEYIRMDVTSQTSTEYLNASFQPNTIDNVSEYI